MGRREAGEPRMGKAIVCIQGRNAEKSKIHVSVVFLSVSCLVGIAHFSPRQKP